MSTYTYLWQTYISDQLLSAWEMRKLYAILKISPEQTDSNFICVFWVSPQCGRCATVCQTKWQKYVLKCVYIHCMSFGKWMTHTSINVTSYRPPNKNCTRLQLYLPLILFKSKYGCSWIMSSIHGLDLSNVNNHLQWSIR